MLKTSLHVLSTHEYGIARLIKHDGMLTHEGRKIGQFVQHNEIRNTDRLVTCSMLPTHTYKHTYVDIEISLDMWCTKPSIYMID